MRKLLFLCVCVALLTACGNKAQNEALKAQNDSLTYVLAERDAELDDIMSAFNEVQEGFRQINEAENRILLDDEPYSSSLVRKRLFEHLKQFEL